MGRKKGDYLEHIRIRNEQRKKSAHCERGHARIPENRTTDRRCRLCQQLTSKAYTKKNSAILKVWHKFHHILKTYGLTREAYEEKLQRQEHRCQICRTLMTEPCVDHDHDTKQVRDLLCKSCNAAVGYVGENFQTAESLVAYLKKWKF